MRRLSQHRTPPLFARARGRSPFALTLVAAGLLAAAAPAGARQTANAAPPDLPIAAPNREAALLATLHDAAAPRRDREAAAAELLDNDRHRTVAAGLRDLLASPADESGARDVLLGVLARRPVAPVSLFRPLAELVERSEPAHLPAQLAALGSFRTRDAAELLVRYAGPAHPPAVRAAAFSALVRLTGRDDLGQDEAAWAAWSRSVANLSETEWRGVLAAGLAARADRVEAARQGTTAQLLEVYRALYLARPPEERGKIIAHLLLEKTPELQSLGFEILARELSAGVRSIDGAVTEAAVKLLADPRATVRARAANVLNQLAPPGVANEVLAALDRETDPDAAAALMLTAARWPDERILAPALRWLDAPGPARAQAIDALMVLHRNDLLRNGADRDRILATLRSQDAATLRPAGLRILAALGEEADRQRIADLLGHEAAAVRLAAADALAERPESLDLILAAAAQDPGLFETAVRAVCAHRPTAEGYQRLAALNAATPEARRDGLVAAAGRLPVGELIAIAREMRADSDLREVMLARLLRRPGSAGAPDEAQLAAINEGLFLLAETRLAMGRPESALAALDAIPHDGHASERTVALATVALLWTNRPAMAAELDAPAGAWLDGLERSIAEPHAREIAGLIDARFAGKLTPEEAARFQALLKRLAERTPPPPAEETAAAAEPAEGPSSPDDPPR